MESHVDGRASDATTETHGIRDTEIAAADQMTNPQLDAKTVGIPRNTEVREERWGPFDGMRTVVAHIFVDLLVDATPRDRALTRGTTRYDTPLFTNSKGT